MRAVMSLLITFLPISPAIILFRRPQNWAQYLSWNGDTRNATVSAIKLHKAREKKKNFQIFIATPLRRITAVIRFCHTPNIVGGKAIYAAFTLHFLGLSLLSFDRSRFSWVHNLIWWQSLSCNLQRNFLFFSEKWRGKFCLRLPVFRYFLHEASNKL